MRESKCTCSLPHEHTVWEFTSQGSKLTQVPTKKHLHPFLVGLKTIVCWSYNLKEVSHKERCRIRDHFNSTYKEVVCISRFFFGKSNWPTAKKVSSCIPSIVFSIASSGMSHLRGPVPPRSRCRRSARGCRLRSWEGWDGRHKGSQRSCHREKPSGSLKTYGRIKSAPTSWLVVSDVVDELLRGFFRHHDSTIDLFVSFWIRKSCSATELHLMINESTSYAQHSRFINLKRCSSLPLQK